MDPEHPPNHAVSSSSPPSSPSQTYPSTLSEIIRRPTRSPSRHQSHLPPLRHIVSSHQTMSSLSEDPEYPRPPQPPSPIPPQANAPPSADEVTVSRLTAHYVGLVLAAMVGTLVRLGLDALATYDGMVIYPLAWAQGVGCVIMGLALARKNEIVELYPPLYTFLTTGIAGSITTFSSWMLEGYLAFSNSGQYNRKGLHDTVDGLGYSFSTFLISLAGIHVGAHLSSVLPTLPTPHRETAPIELSRPSDHSPSDDSTPPSSDKPPRNPISGKTPLLDFLTVLSAVLSYLTALLLYFLAPETWRHRATFVILLAPPGAMLRFALGRINVRSPFLDRFPLGTFIANISATLIIAGVFAAQRRPGANGGSGLACNALYAIQQGFCGCLSTVSTFVVEGRAIRRKRWKWIYVGSSVVLGQVLVLAIVGGIGWDKGYQGVCTG